MAFLDKGVEGVRRADVESFYHLTDVSLEGRLCTGLGCFAAQGLNPQRWREALRQDPPIFCLGRCFSAPSCSDDTSVPQIQTLVEDAIVLEGIPNGDRRSLPQYGRYAALEQAHRMGAASVIAEIERSQLRGRGGAGFPAGRKWRSVADQSGAVKYVVANADEGDHGSYIDKTILEEAPHRLLEAMAIAGFAVGATRGYIYIRKEYPLALKRLLVAIEEARAFGIKFEFEVTVGQGSYVCGEETSLLNSIEHRRPEVRVRPPFPTEQGLFRKPTLVQNVETLANVPWIVRNGGAAYAARGFSSSRGTKAISLSSLFMNPGIYEIEFGASLRTILDEIGGGLKTGPMKAAIVGGPLAGLIHPSEVDTPFGFEEMASIGASVGHGGIVAFDEGTRIVDLLAHAFRFGAAESCGKCTPCRLGSRKVQRMLEQGAIRPDQRDEFDETLAAMRWTSLCGHGSGLAILAHSAIAKFGEELF